MLFFAVILNILLTQVVYSLNWQHEIYVSTTTGINDTSCWTGGQHTPCATFNLALRGLQHNSTVIYITPGNYILEYGEETQLRYKSQIGMIGKVANSRGEQQKIVIKCNSFTGLSFMWSEDIILKSIIFHGCGGIQVSTSRNLSSQSFELLMFQVATYMLYCQNVHIVDVVIESSNGTGLTIYNTVGNVTISGCVFMENGVEVSYGGGGLQIEWSYCNPKNELDCPKEALPSAHNSYGSLYNIINCSFTFNMAKRGFMSSHYKLSNQGRDSYVFGNGGGVSIIFKGQASNNKIIMYSNILEGNQADHGGGFYIGYYDNANNNSVEMSHMTITNNSNPHIDYVRYYDDRGGGGGKIVHTSKYINGIKQPTNSITVLDSIVSDNIGITGGGLSVTTGSGINLYLIEVLLTGNIAYLGSACYFIKGFDFTQSETIQITNSTFSSNRPTCDVHTVHSFVILPCSGTLYSSSVPILFNGINTFNNNNVSAIEVHGSVIMINPGTGMSFTGNNAVYGGAIALYECSYIVLYNETKLAFNDNTATFRGGAIYSGPCNSQQTQSSCCFIVYYNSDVHPDEWETEMIFFSNVCGLGYNAIFATSLSSCWWPLYPNTSDITLSSIKKTLRWNKWNYTPDNCINSVQSGLAFLNDSRNITIQPGARFKIDVYDGSGQLSSDKINYCVSSDPNIIGFLDNNQQNQKCVTEFEPILYQFSNNKKCQLITQSFYLRITTLGSDPLQANYNVTLQDCEWPFKFEFINHKAEDLFYVFGCKMSIPGFCCSDYWNCFTGTDSQCTVGSYYYGILPGYCLSSYNSQQVIGRCPLFRRDSDFYYTNCSYINYYYNFLQDINNCMKINSDFPYTGRLNGACKSNNCVAINSPYFECTDDGIVINLLIVFTIEILPVTILVILIIVLNVKLTNGSLNGYVFFCQIVSTSFPIINSVWFIIDTNCITFPHNIWNLNFLNVIPFPVCITPTMGSLGAIAFWYVIAFYPFLLLFFLYGWITMYNKGFRCVITITRPLHRLLARFWRMTNIEPSLTHSISSIYVLCFTQFTATSLKLLHFTKWYSLTNENETGIAFYYDGTLDYFGYPHAFLGILAIIVLIVVVFIPTVYLLLHPFKWFHKILDWCKLKRPQFVMTVVDDYTGAFKNGCNNTNDYRYFAGLYLLLRIVIICLYYIPIQHHLIIMGIQISVFVVVGGAITIFRPYRKNIHNFSEFLLLLILAFLSGIAIISFHSISFISFFFFIANIILLYFPSFIVILYCMYWIIKKVRSCCLYYKDTRRPQTDPIEEDIPSDSDDNLFADRIMNPDEYNEYHVSTVPYDYESPQTPKESTTTHYQGTTHHATYGTLTNRTSINSTTKSRYGTTTNSGTFNEMRHLTD